jgi:general secretion pathway protein A
MLTLFGSHDRSETALTRVARKPVTRMQPFGLSPNPRFMYRSDAYIWAFEQITAAVRQREGLVLVTGEPGTGKTLMCRTLLSRLSGQHLVSVILDPCVRIEELLQQMLQDFGVLGAPRGSEPPGRHELVATLHRFLASLIPQNMTAVLVIDEAQHLHPSVLEQLRLLSNCESDRAKLLQIILVGTPALEQFCHSPRMQHLDQRIARRCRLHPLRHEEIADYIQSRLSAAADEPVLHLDSHGDVCQLASLDDASESMGFPAPAVDAIATLSGGVPRVINLLCERSLDIAWRRGVSPVDANMVRAAARQLDIPVPSQWFMSTRTAMVAGMLLLGVPSATWLWASQAGRATTVSSKPAPLLRPEGPVALASVSTRAAALVPDRSDETTIGTLTLADGFTIQVGTFRGADRAAAVVQQLRGTGLPAFRRADGGGLWHLVLVGPYVADTEVQAVRQALAGQGFGHTKVVREDAGSLLP